MSKPKDISTAGTRRASAKSYSHLTADYFQRGLAIDLDTSGADLTGAVQAHGVEVTWKRAAVCPNVRVQRGGPPRHNFDCPICKGRRYVYWEEQDLLATFQNLNVEQSYYIAGRFLSGTVRVTFPSGRVPTYWDMIIPKKDLILYSEVTYVSKATPNIFTLQYDPLQIEKGYCVVNRNNWPLGTIPQGTADQQEVLYTFSKDDFEILPDKRVLVKPKLPMTAAVTFVYWHRPEFVIVDIERVSRFTADLKGGDVEQNLEGYPITAIARLDYFVHDDDDKEAQDHYLYDTGEKLIPDE